MIDAQSIEALKMRFQQGDKPTERDFADLIDLLKSSNDNTIVLLDFEEIALKEMLERINNCNINLLAERSKKIDYLLSLL